MATQQMHFAETIAGMKRALKQNPYDSDSDEEIQGTSNRGNKLQKRSRYVYQGQISTPSGPSVYRQIIEHAGYQRAIIHRNPLPVDEDGFTLDSDDDDEYIQQVTAAAAEENPYSSIRLERILAPLTSTSDLADHPTMSRAYTSRTLTDLSLQGRDVMHKENQSLWKVKHLLTQLCGDHYWAPTGLMEGPNDIDLFTKQIMGLSSTSDLRGEVAEDNSPALGEKPEINNSYKDASPSVLKSGEDTEMLDGSPSNVASEQSNTKGSKSDARSDGEILERATGTRADATAEMKAFKPNGNGKEVQQSGTINLDLLTQGADAASVPRLNGVRPNDAAEGSKLEERPIPSNTEDLFIHPLFLQPESSKPDRDFFLPQEEAEELRRLLQLYVQRQEEICRGSSRLYEGLLKADRLRKMALFWSKAEAHSGANRDLSDGEDWYDMNEWGLEEPLKKGHDDEEEEAQQNQKKTRNRR